MSAAISRIEELLSSGRYRLVAVRHRRDEGLILGRIHQATFALLDCVEEAHPAEYERVWVELKTEDERRWARAKLERG